MTYLPGFYKRNGGTLPRSTRTWSFGRSEAAQCIEDLALTRYENEKNRKEDR